MNLVRREMSAMSEADLRTRVLIPLFRAMGYREVRHYHGGTGERGKDIVMWKASEFGDRVNYGVVVKAGRVSGKASGKGSANEVLFQTMQAYNESYADLTNAEEQHIHHCLVVASGEIPKETIDAIKGTLRRNNLDRTTKFIPGDELWELIEKHMPAQTAADHLRLAGEKLNAASEHVSIVASTDGKFVCKPKYSGAWKDNPEAFITRFDFNRDTPAGRDAHERFVRHIVTGEPVSFLKSHLSEFVPPDFLRPLLEPLGERLEVRISSPRGERSVWIKLTITTASGDQASLDRLHLESTQIGTEEITLDNEHQDVPWRMRLSFNLRTRLFKIDYSMRYPGANVKEALEGHRFHEAISEGGELHIEDAKTGIIVREDLSPSKRKGTATKKSDARLRRLLEALVLIQRKASTLLTIPREGIPLAEAQTIHAAAQIFSTGRATFHPETQVTRSTPGQGRAAITTFADKASVSLFMHMRDGQIITVFGTEIRTGPVLIECERAHITPEDMAELKAAVEVAAPDDVVSIRITPDKGTDLKASFLDWLPVEEANALRRAIPALPDAGDVDQPGEDGSYEGESVDAWCDKESEPARCA